MTLHQFLAFDEATQIRTIWKRGVHIGSNEDSSYQYLLYQVDSFYVEVWYHSALDSFDRFWAFADTVFLEPYLEQIDIDVLY